MAKTIVNKHFDNKELVNREQFHENEQYAKGELLIVNEQNPSIYVLNSDGVPRPISSGIETVNNEINSIKQTIVDNKTVTDAALDDLDIRIDEINDKVGDITTNNPAIDDFKNEINESLTKLQTSYEKADINIKQLVIDTEKNILAHSINGKAISTNPVLEANDILIGVYNDTILPETASAAISSNDSTRDALKKLENMTLANALAFSAAVNNLNARIESMGEFNSVLNRLATLEEENETLKQKVVEMENLINEMSK